MHGFFCYFNLINYLIDFYCCVAHQIEDPKRYKLLGDIRTKKQIKLNSAESSLKSAENVKRNREEFRRSLVDIIM